MPDVDSDLLRVLRSPDTGAELVDGRVMLRDIGGVESFPMVNGVPILLPRSSAFHLDDYLAPVEADSRAVRSLRAVARRALPSLSHNRAATANFKRFAEQVRLGSPVARPVVLVVGGAIVGEGMQTIVDDPSLRLVETDVALGPRTDVICDAHFLPFADGAFDGVICQAVLEHVADPLRAVAEIHRVLRPNGLVYSEIPFMQQVHEGAYDFTRFTNNGHRRLFHRFEELDTGPTAGPGMSLGWAARAFLISFAGKRRMMRNAINLLATLALFWLKYLDSWIETDAALDGASGTYFLGRRNDRVRSDGEIIAGYRGVDSGFSSRR